MMADRVHPTSDYSGEIPPGNHSSSSSDPSSSPLYHPSDFHGKSDLSSSPSPDYVIQVPKDQIYRVPPPENAHLIKTYTRRAAGRRRSRGCCRFLACFALVLLSLAVAIAATAAVLYLVYRPKLPSYSFDSLTVKNLNLSLPAGAAFSPEIDAAVRAVNPNSKISIFYREGSSISVFYDGVNLANGVWPAFDQKPKNVTAFVTALTGKGIRLSSAMHTKMLTAEKRREVPLTVDARVPVRVKFGAVTTWTITVKVKCDVTVDKLTPAAKIVSKTCHVKVNL
ncbi:NDR1/HIN1-like protein 13 [Typha latifolia]|uniref:NDR1/HIN1-like protein 13 n=1 Tax=Typha latifolia TaxID=4733 RepID=UPI003C2EA8DC